VRSDKNITESAATYRAVLCDEIAKIIAPFLRALMCRPLGALIAKHDCIEPSQKCCSLPCLALDALQQLDALHGAIRERFLLS